MPTINFSAIEEPRSYDSEPTEPVPPGTYECKVQSVEESTTKEGGHPMWIVHFTIEAGEHAGRTVLDRLFFTPKALPRVKLACRALGVDTDGEVELEPEMVMGERCQLVVRTKSFKGRQENEVPFAGYLPPSS